MQQITTFLMFPGTAQAAMDFYCSLFPGAHIVSVKRYGPGESGTEGSVMHAIFALGGQEFMCIDTNAAHGFTFTPAMSLYIRCATEAEIDVLFTKLSDGGSVLMPLGSYPFSKRYAWVSDKFGVSWQLSME